MNRCFFLPVFFLFLLLSCIPRPERDVLRILSWNLQNLFDAEENGREYPEFKSPSSRWNEELFRLRLSLLGTVLRKIKPPPDILLFQEVENAFVLGELQKHLNGYPYSFIPESFFSAVNPGVLSRIPLLRVHQWETGFRKEHRLRAILEIHLSFPARSARLSGSRGSRDSPKTLVLFNNHWKSQNPSPRETEQSRLDAAAILTNRIRFLLEEEPRRGIIIAGDLNENIDAFRRGGFRYLTALLPEEFLDRGGAGNLYFTDDPSRTGRKGDKLIFYSPWGGSAFPGSYFYRGRWSTPDHFFLSAGLFGGGAFVFRDFRILSLPALANQKGRPLRWYSSLRSGFSDHFPLLLSLQSSFASPRKKKKDALFQKNPDSR